MAVLSDENREKVWRGLMRYWSVFREHLGDFTKADLRAAVNATDQWQEDNQTSFNGALPELFKSEATLAQKTLLFCAVALARVSTELLRKVLGEVD